ncbi:hypothetical protein [Kribbella sp. NPDC051770]|uniref:hypothetical protein n=1 Tax=Kribbella sp. NPDC051770 TaxID=3155413 RepID=UPI0034345F7A
MAEPGEPTPERDEAARIAETRRAMERGLPPVKGATAAGAGAGGGAAAGGAAAGGAAAAGPPELAEEMVRKAKEAVEKAQAAVDAFTVEEMWSASQGSKGSQGSPPDHRRQSGRGRPPGQQSDRSGPGHRGPHR